MSDQATGAVQPRDAAQSDQVPSHSPGPTDDEKKTAGASIVGETWEPTCVSCRAPLGYKAKRNSYGFGRTQCRTCNSGDIKLRLEESGIALSELDVPLHALKPHGPDEKPYGQDWFRYIAFLQRFANLAPGERMMPPFAFVCGSNGVGKSAGAQRALRDAIRNGCQGRFRRLSQILDSIYATYGRDDQTAAELMRFYATVHLLVVDEVGQETPGEHAMSRFFDLVDDRWRNRMPTIFTSNYLAEPNSLGAHINERSADATHSFGILDRLSGGCGDQIFVIRGASWRRRKS